MKIGIDNGLKGAAVAIHDGKVVSWLLFKPMIPTRTIGMVDIDPVIEWLRVMNDMGHCIEVLLEEPAMNMGGSSRGTTAQSIASTAATFGRILAALGLAGIHDVRTTPAVCWQKLFWKTNIKSDIKQSIGIAQLVFGEKFIPPKCRVPHDGLTDAALMALVLEREDLRTRLLGDKEARVAKKIRRKGKVSRKDLEAVKSVLLQSAPCLTKSVSKKACSPCQNRSDSSS